jgi:hypothetical protein
MFSNGENKPPLFNQIHEMMGGTEGSQNGSIFFLKMS